MKKEKQENIKEAGEVIVSRHDIIDIPIGTHEGVIADVSKRVSEGEEVYNYLSINVDLTDIKSDGDPISLNMGFPLNLSTASGLGKLLIASGFDINSKKDYTISDFRNILLHKKIRFLTDKNERGFSNILRDTVRFIG